MFRARLPPLSLPTLIHPPMHPSTPSMLLHEPTRPKFSIQEGKNIHTMCATLAGIKKRKEKKDLTRSLSSFGNTVQSGSWGPNIRYRKAFCIHRLASPPHNLLNIHLLLDTMYHSRAVMGQPARQEHRGQTRCFSSPLLSHQDRLDKFPHQ